MVRHGAETEGRGFGNGEVARSLLKDLRPPTIVMLNLFQHPFRLPNGHRKLKIGP